MKCLRLFIFVLFPFVLRAETVSVSLGQWNVGTKTSLNPTVWALNNTWTASYSLPLTTAGWYHVRSSPTGEWVLGGTFNSGNSGANPKTGNVNLSWLKSEYFAVRFHIRVLNAQSQPVEQQTQEYEFPVITPPQNRVHLALTNPSLTNDMEYRVYQDGNLIHTVTVPAGKSQSAVIEVPADSEVSVYARVKGIVIEFGGWVEDPTAVTDLGPVQQESGDPINPTTVSPPPPTNINPPENVPNNGKPKDKDKPIWNPSTAATLDSERLDKATYREGVDKIVSALRETVDLSLEDPPQAGDSAVLSGGPQKAQVTAVLAKLPAVPSLVHPGVVSSFSFNLNIPHVGSKTFEVDLSDYQAGISIFRTICSGVLLLLFWLGVVTIIRGAFAN